MILGNELIRKLNDAAADGLDSVFEL